MTNHEPHGHDKGASGVCTCDGCNPERAASLHADRLAEDVGRIEQQRGMENPRRFTGHAEGEAQGERPTPNYHARMNLLVAAGRGYGGKAALAYVEGYNAALELLKAEPKSAGPQGERPIDIFWREVARGWDIESREWFETNYQQRGYSDPVTMAVHHMWKRDRLPLAEATLTGEDK